MFSIITGLLLACSSSTNTTTETLDSPIPPVNATPTTAVPGTVATWNGGELSYEEGTKLAKGQLIQLEAEYLTSTYQTAMQSIEQTILEKLLEVEVKNGGFASQEELLKKKWKTKWLNPLKKRSPKCTSSSKIVFKAWIWYLHLHSFVTNSCVKSKVNVFRCTWKRSKPSTT